MIVIPSDWAEHRRDDGELLGWLLPSDDYWVPIDRLGRPLSGPVNWLDAEALLDGRGLGWLADRWWLADRPVRIAEVSPEHVVVVTDDYGAAATIDGPATRIELPWPAPEELRPDRPTG